MQAELIYHQLHVNNIAIAQTVRKFIEVVLLPQLQNPLKFFFWPATYLCLFIQGNTTMH